MTLVRLALFSDSYPPQLNGVALLLARLADAVRERGGAVRIFTTSDPAARPDPDISRWPSVAYWRYPEHRIALPNPWSVRRAVQEWAPTIVHAASPFGMGLAGRSAARSLGIPFVTSYHTNWLAYTGYYGLGALRGIAWPYLRWFHNGGARTYAPTHAIQDELTAHGVERTEIWGRGVDANLFHPRFRSAALRAQLGVAEDALLAIYVGRLSAEKGLGVALTGMHAVQRGARTRVVCAIAGDGPYADQYRAMAPPGTHFVGRLSGQELSTFYASADLFLFPSVTDTFGNVLLEAMASGVPAVGADVGPTRELLAGGRGVTFPQGDEAAFAAQVIALADDPDRRRALAEAAFAHAARSTWERVFDDLMADYARVIAGSASAASPAPASATLLNPLPPRRLQH